jgi:hypothetical protein
VERAFPRPRRGRVIRGDSEKLTFVPEGPNDRSQAIYCLEQVRLKIRPGGHGLILTDGWLIVLIVARLSDPSYRPYGTDPFLNGFQAINCLATIVWSLRDKHACVLMLTRIGAAAGGQRSPASGYLASTSFSFT